MSQEEINYQKHQQDQKMENKAIQIESDQKKIVRDKSQSQKQKKDRKEHKKHKNKKNQFKRNQKSQSRSRSRSKSKSNKKSKKEKQKQKQKQRQKSNSSNFSQSPKKQKYKKYDSKSKSIEKRILEDTKDENKKMFLKYYTTQIAGQNGNNNYINDIQVHNELYWDGFQWIARDLNSSSKDLRTIQISGLPLDVCQFNEFQLSQFIVNFMKQHSLNEHSNNWPVRSCKINNDNYSALIELTTIDETNRLKLVGKIQILDRECKISKVQLANTNIYNFSNILEGAQKAAMAQAISYKAMNTIQSDMKDLKKEQQLEKKKLQQQENQQ